MIILGIDPGTLIMGYGVIETDDDKVSLGAPDSFLQRAFGNNNSLPA